MTPNAPRRYEDLPDMLTPEEYWTWMRVSRNTAYEFLRRGEIPHVRHGRIYRIPKAALLIPGKNG